VTASHVDSAAGACRHKLVLRTSDHDEARRTATSLSELIDPPADAVAIFEMPGAAPDSPPAGWRVDAYFIERPEAGEIADAIAALVGIAKPDLQLDTVPDENWVTLSQAALPPVTAGRFTVLGSHDRARIPRGPWSLVIDAGEAFGTAHHATTLGCLLTIDRLAHRWQRARVLDLGCGTGVLAIAAQRALPRARVTASDIDPVAVEVARANARLNGATTIRAVVADGVPRGAQGNDLLIANILARPLIALAGDIVRALAPGGRLILSGLLTSQAREVSAAYLARGLTLERHDRIAGWSTLTMAARRMRRGTR
jgi:ribosomal protein L11 methyltransferase